MKKIVSGMLSFLLILILIPGVFVNAADTNITKEFRGVWVSTVMNLDFPSKPGLSTDVLKREIDAILDKTVDLNLNAVVLQVRPSGDALYKSDLFVWSEYLTGEQGKAPADGFDPLEYWVAEAHKRGLMLHAWVNPYRVSHTTAKRSGVAELAEGNFARKNPQTVIAYKDGGLYYDPGLPETRRLIIDGVAEIVKKYDVDGIHLDDYFYPGMDFNDAVSYAQYGNGAALADWRRENVNALIKGIQETIRALNPKVKFGVSPFAIWQNKSSDALGSDTRGKEAYKELYADTRRWVKEGWLDYICPQIYWYISYEIADYEKVLNWWIDVCQGTNVDLYVGHAAYKEDQADPLYQGEMVRQLAMNDKYDIVKGSVFFRFNNLKGALGNQIRYYFAGAAAAVTAADNGVQAVQPVYSAQWDKNALMVKRPAGNTETTADKYYILGSSNPEKSLSMNGAEVTNRNAEGFFGVYVSLSPGINEFTFSQPGHEDVKRVITYNVPRTVQAVPEVMKEAAISDMFPKTDEYLSAGNTAKLKCSAPSGAAVTVTINGEVITLSENGTQPNDGKIYKASYTYSYTLPKTPESGRVIDMGPIEYKMIYKGKEYTSNSAARLYCITENAPIYATITAENTWTYPDATTTGGPIWELSKGQRDMITAITKEGSWARLKTGQWVQTGDISYKTEPERLNGSLGEARYIAGIRSNQDSVTWSADTIPTTNISLKDGLLYVHFALADTLPEITVPEGALTDTVTVGNEKGYPGYVFKPAEGVRYEGYYITTGQGSITLNLISKKRAPDNDKPLNGFKIVIDAGHGKNDSGAIGPLGNIISEKDLNLINAVNLAEKLRALGADVVTVRSTDVFYELYERTDISRAQRPDLFVSIHANSVAESTDSTNINGLTVWYRNDNSKPFADFLFSAIHDVNPLTNRSRQTNQSNLYVCRPYWTPSVIIETSFMCNINDFAWLINENEQNRLADAVAGGIVEYFKSDY